MPPIGSMSQWHNTFLSPIGSIKQNFLYFGLMNLLEGLNFPDNTINYLSNLFRSIREQLCFTQEEMAQLLGTTQKVYQRWETGHREPTGEYTAKVFLIRDYLNSQSQNSINLVNPIDIAKELSFQISEQQDIQSLLIDMAKPTIVLIKDLLWYAHAVGEGQRRTFLNKPPFYIEWNPETSAGLLTVVLNFRLPTRQFIVLEAHNVHTKTNFDSVAIIVYHPGKWISVLQEALTLYKSRSCLGIDDQAVLSEMRAAFGLDKDSEHTDKE